MKANEFDKKFDEAWKTSSTTCTCPRATRPNEPSRRVNVDFPRGCRLLSARRNDSG